MTDLAERFMKDTPRKEASSVRLGRSSWDCHILPHVCKRRVADIDRSDIERRLARRLVDRHRPLSDPRRHLALIFITSSSLERLVEPGTSDSPATIDSGHRDALDLGDLAMVETAEEAHLDELGAVGI